MGKDKVNCVAAGLRYKAEDELKVSAAEAGFSLTDNKTRQLLHELQVHQLELKLQNAELCRARDEMEALLQTMYLSLDPYMRGRMSAAPSYAPPLALGEVMVGGTV